jgi:hypothetical protein
MLRVRKSWNYSERGGMSARKTPGDDTPKERAEAEARVANAAMAVARQRKIAATLRRRRLNARDADARLAQLEQKLLEFEEQLAAVLREDRAAD